MRILPLGDAALTVQLGNNIDRQTHQLVINYCDKLAEAQNAGKLTGVIEWLAAFCSVSIYFNPLIISGQQLSQKLLNFDLSSSKTKTAGRQWQIPILFNDESAPDLSEVAKLCQMSREEVINEIITSQFHVYLLGFMPGFPYMGGLPECLSVPRLATPRKVVPARSLAIAGNMCAIYPWQSPGGWRLIGRTPLTLFDSNKQISPALFAPGDQVSWQAINQQDFYQLEADVLAGKIDCQHFCHTG